MTETLVIIGAVLAMVALSVVTFRWGRSTRDGSSVEVSSLNIVARDSGWIAGFAKLGRLRRSLKSEAATRRMIADAKKAAQRGSVGSVVQLLKDARKLPD